MKWRIYLSLLLLVLNLFLALWVRRLDEKQFYYLFIASDGYWSIFVQNIYPRLFTEYARLGGAFFIDKLLLLSWRVHWLSLIGVVWVYLSSLLPPSSYKVIPYQVGILCVRCFVLLAAWHSMDWFWLLSAASDWVAFYQPIGILKWLNVPFPSFFFLGVCFFLFYFFLLFLFLFPAHFWWAVLSVVSWVILQGWLYSFGKLDHTFAPFTMVSFCIPFVSYELYRARFQKETIPLEIYRYIALAVVLPYFLSGLEKLSVSGFSWADGSTLAFYLRLHGQAWGIWLAEHWFLCLLFSLATLFFQLSSLLVLFFPFWRYVFVVLGVFFHLSTYIFMGVGGWVSPWLLDYVFLFLKPYPKNN